jgi:PAS domain S-box-containing protein
LLLRDITLDMQQHRLADAKGAMLRAMALHGTIGTMRLSAQGFIKDADPAFCALIGLPEGKLIDIALPDLIDIASRPVFRRQMEQVLRGESDVSLETQLLTNADGPYPIDAALVRLSGTYGTEGAVMIVTRTAG